MTIKHFVFPGGGPSMFRTLGSLEYLHKQKYWNFSDIISIYGTSSGSILGVIVALQMDWDILTNYIINRPWQELIKISPSQLLNYFTQKGVFDYTILEKMLKPLFDSKNIPIDINLKDFFEITKIELHFITLELNNFILEDISYLNYPDLSIVKACTMSSTLPFFISPLYLENKCFIDGGILNNYPVSICLEKYPNKEELLGFKNEYPKSLNEDVIINSETNILTFIAEFLKKLIYNLKSQNDNIIKLPYEVTCLTCEMSFDYLTRSNNEPSFRKGLIESGHNFAKLFLENHGYKYNENTQIYEKYEMCEKSDKSEIINEV
jgi:hypothetical protein